MISHNSTRFNKHINTSGKVDIVALNKAIEHIREQAGENVNIFWGTVSEKSDSTDIVVTLLATGMKQVKSTNTIPTDVKKQMPVQPAPMPASNATAEPRIDTFKQVNTNGNNSLPPLKEFKFQVKPASLQVPEFLKQHNRS
ncbi:hypothetical protein [Butyrivibrio fibrisolvens]|uniref:hypothetical protein n=1 Tax=Butyrivibrio fibrisolvens TaxID=831 RepID=UPI0003B6CFCA|nr:hypothetical protein [Butyrivibrio fibrisolvens]